MEIPQDFVVHNLETLVDDLDRIVEELRFCQQAARKALAAHRKGKPVPESVDRVLAGLFASPLAAEIDRRYFERLSGGVKRPN